MEKHECGRARRAAGAMIVSVAMASTAVAGSAPANDDCSDAQNIGLTQAPFTTADATSAGPGVCVNFGKDVWFKHRARFTGILTVSTCDAANFDTVIAVYRGGGCADATLIANMIGCNDDKSGCDDGTSELNVSVTKDQVYLVRVGGFNADSGTGVLTLRCGDPESAACADIARAGDAADDRFGTSLAEGGFMNADLQADVLIGSPLNDAAGDKAGRAVALRGDNLANLYTKNGAAAGDQLGTVVATCDVNNDGRIDLVVGAPFNDDAASNAGKVYVFDGFTGNLLWSAEGQAAGDRFGQACGCAGDVNDDGFIDVIVGAPFNDAKGTSAGRAYILDGENGSRIRAHSGQRAGDQFGSAVAGIGDLNNDGHDDYAIGSPRYDKTGAADAGRVTLYNGDTAGVLIRLDGDNAGDRFGTAIAAARFTVTFDYTFIAIGAPFNDLGANNAGRTRVFFRNHDNPGEGGCNQIVCLRYTINGTSPNGRLGSSLALGDVVGNAAADIIVGAPYTSTAGNSAGAAFVFDGNGGALSRRYFGEAAGDRFGSAVAFAGDIDNNGENDLVMGAPFNDAGGNNAGRAYAFLLGTSSLLSTGGMDDAPQAAGDVTLDGVVDADDVLAIIGAWGPCPTEASGLPCPADLDHNRRVDIDDLLLTLASWRE